jgi:hypothetical protein
MAQLFTVEIKDQETGSIVWTKKNVPGDMLMSLAAMFDQTTKTTGDITSAVRDISRAANTIKMAFGRKK